MPESLGYKVGGYFGTKEEATLNIEPFRLHIEHLRETHSTSGGSSASHKKVYLAATRNTMLSGGRDQVVAEAGFAARKRPSGNNQKPPNSLHTTEQLEVKNQKLPKRLQAIVRARRAEKFAQMRAAL